MKWYIRNSPQSGPFDTRGEAVAWAWSKTVPGMQRAKVDGVADPEDSDHISCHRMQITLQAFQQLGEEAENSAREIRRMMKQIEGVIPETLEGKAVELKADRYNITFTAERRSPL